MPSTQNSLHTRWDGHTSMALVIEDFLERMHEDPLLWQAWNGPRAAVLERRMRQLTVDYIASAIGGPILHVNHDEEAAPTGMGLSSYEYAAFTRNLEATLEKFAVPEPVRGDIVTFITSLKSQIVAQQHTQRQSLDQQDNGYQPNG